MSKQKTTKVAVLPQEYNKPRLMKVVPEKFLKISDDITLRYIDFENKHKKNNTERRTQNTEEKEALLFIHCFCGSLNNWIFNFSTLSKYYHTLAFDLPGYGGSTKPEAVSGKTYNMNFFADTVFTFINKMKLKKVTLIGNSLGGHISLYTAYKYQHTGKISKLVLVDNAGAIPIPEPFKQLTAYILRKYTPKLWFYKPKKWLLRLIFDYCFFKYGKVSNAFIKDIEEYIKTLNYTYWLKILGETIASVIEDDLTYKLHEIKVPVMVVWGKQDFLVPSICAAIQKYKIPNCKVEMFDYCGHFPQMEYPIKFNKLLLDFVGNGRRT